MFSHTNNTPSKNGSHPRLARNSSAVAGDVKNEDGSVDPNKEMLDQNLPKDVLELILNKLDTPSLLNLRHTCRWFKSATKKV